jgi:hypothetical protein
MALELSRNMSSEVSARPVPMQVDGPEGTAISKEDAEMNRVLLESFQTAQHGGATVTDFMPDNPTLRVRAGEEYDFRSRNSTHCAS